MNVITLSLLVLVGLASAHTARDEGASSLLAAVLGTGAAVLVYLLTC